MYKAIVEIKKPCRVDLKTMIPDEKGIFCGVCQTAVIDFTDKTPDEIAQYFQLQKNEKNCGIFKNTDVKTDSKFDNLIFFLHSRKLKFVAIFITGLLILTGCKTKKQTTTSYGSGRALDEKTNSIENVK